MMHGPLNVKYTIPVYIKGISERLHVGFLLLDAFTFCFFHNNVQGMLVLHVGHTHTHFDCCMDMRKVTVLLPYLKILLI